MAACDVFLNSAFQRGFLQAQNLLQMMIKGTCLKQVFLVIRAVFLIQNLISMHILYLLLNPQLQLLVFFFLYSQS